MALALLLLAGLQLIAGSNDGADDLALNQAPAPAQSISEATEIANQLVAANSEALSAMGPGYRPEHVADFAMGPHESFLNALIRERDTMAPLHLGDIEILDLAVIESQPTMIQAEYCADVHFIESPDIGGAWPEREGSFLRQADIRIEDGVWKLYFDGYVADQNGVTPCE